MDDKIKKLKEIAKKELSDCSAHNIDHVMRVFNIAMTLAKGEDVDIEVIQVAVLLHDIGGIKEANDPSGNTDHAVESAKMAEPILKNLGYSEEKIKHIQDCIVSHRYRTKNKPQTKEAEIIFDADKLDAIGAIGIARSFAWVGKNKAHIYKKMDAEEYAKDNLEGEKINGRIKDRTKHSPQIEFELKIKFLKDKLYTEGAKKMCDERMAFHKNFLDRLEREINGEL